MSKGFRAVLNLDCPLKSKVTWNGEPLPVSRVTIDMNCTEGHAAVDFCGGEVELISAMAPDVPFEQIEALAHGAGYWLVEMQDGESPAQPQKTEDQP